MQKKQLISIIIIILFISCKQNYEPGSEDFISQVTIEVDDEMLKNNNEKSGNWLTYGGNYSEDHYSELDQIRKENIGNLGLAWSLDLGTKRGIEATPIVVDGIMYLTGTWSVVYAVDARKGTLIWKYDPKVPREYGEYACCDVVNRGVALYKGVIYFGTIDGRLVALDAANGSLKWEKLTVNKEHKYSITGAPRIVNGNVLIGNGGAEYDARGYVSAYDAATGNLDWRFYTVPGNPNKPFEHADLEEAAKTWTGEWWKKGGGGTAWDAIVFDPELNLVYIGVGNGTPWDRRKRSPKGGDNLYLSSIVAVNADDGSYVWHFQTTPGETWDYTATQPIILADIEIEAKTRKVLMQAPKNGFFYVIDRQTGEFISGKPYTYQNWAKGLDENGRPIEEDYARYGPEQAVVISPGAYGGHNWQPMSYNKKTGLVYIPTSMISVAYDHDPSYKFNEIGGLASGSGWNSSYATKLYKPTRFDPEGPSPFAPFGRLVAYDPVKQEEVWAVPQVMYWNGGILSTSTGLVFQGDAEGMFKAYDADTGEELWEQDLRSGIIGTPMTYMVDDEQYLTIAVGWGGSTGLAKKAVPMIHPGTVYTFKIGGKADHPEKMT
ncbi:MAG: PQQ-dependent dehydrogenase, methanol/ethanol family, partial [Saprospiraceae bacterium]